MPLHSTAPARSAPRSLELPRGRQVHLDPGPLVMGVLNLTPDSFSDGGRWLDPVRAVEHALGMLEAGAHLLDLGAESTRPGGGVYGEGARPVPAAEELRRLLPVLEAVRRYTDAPISVDTRKASVARQALAVGADLVNDISALGDPEMAAAVVDGGCPIVLMHSRGELRTMQREIRFRDPLREIRSDLEQTVRRARAAGIGRGAIVLDPGIGFGKTWDQNLLVLRHLPLLTELGYPVLVGASRKSFIGRLTQAPPADRLPGSLAAAAWAAVGGADILRVHDVSETARFLAVWRAIRDAEVGGEERTPG